MCLVGSTFIGHQWAGKRKKWIINQTKKKGWHRQILKIAFPRLYMRYGEVEMGSLSLKRNWILV